MNAKEEAKKLIDEVRNATDNQIDGYFDSGKAIALAILKNDYTVQQKTRIVDALKNLTFGEYEPD